MRSLILFLHLLGVVVWVGGMFFAHLCLRPVATAQLPPPQRLALMAAVLRRFFLAVDVSVLAIVGSGFAALLSVGFALAPLHWHLMSGLGLLMALIYVLIRSRVYPRLKAGVAVSDWPLAGTAMARLRLLVGINLTLGLLTIAVATLGSAPSLH